MNDIVIEALKHLFADQRVISCYDVGGKYRDEQNVDHWPLPKNAKLRSCQQ